MLWFLAICFIVGLVAMMPFSEDARGCLGAGLKIIFSIAGIVILGALILFGLLALIFG